MFPWRRDMTLASILHRFNRPMDFGVLDVAEGKRSAAVRDDKRLQAGASRRLEEIQAQLEQELTSGVRPRGV